MKISDQDIKRHLSLIKLQRGCEISLIITFLVVCLCFVGVLNVDLVLILVGVEIFGLCVGYFLNPVSKSYGDLLGSVVSSDESNIIN